MDPAVPLVVSQVNPDDLEAHTRASSPTPTARRCSSCRCSWRSATRSGLERVIVDTYQAVTGTGGKAIAELEGQVEAHVGRRAARGERLPPPDRVQRAPAGRRLPRQRLHEGGVEGRHREPQDPPPAGPADLVHGGPHPGVRRAFRGGPRRDARPITPERARELFAAVPGVVVQDDPADLDLPAGHRAAGTDEIYVGRVRQDPSIDDGRGLAFWVVSDNLRKGAATNAVQIAEALVDALGGIARTPGRRAAPTRPRTARAGRRDPRRAPAALEAIAARSAPAPAAGSTRPAPTPSRARASPDTEVVFVGEGPGQRGPPGPAVRRSRRRLLDEAASARSAGNATRSSSPTSSSAGRPRTATRSPTRSPPARPTSSASSRSLDPPWS